MDMELDSEFMAFIASAQFSQNICRLCCEIGLDVVEVLQDEHVIQDIFYFLSIKISREDLLPKKVCKYCIKTIKEWNTFRRESADKNRAMQKQLHKLIHEYVSQNKKYNGSNTERNSMEDNIIVPDILNLEDIIAINKEVDINEQDLFKSQKQNSSERSIMEGNINSNKIINSEFLKLENDLNAMNKDIDMTVRKGITQSQKQDNPKRNNMEGNNNVIVPEAEINIFHTEMDIKIEEEDLQINDDIISDYDDYSESTAHTSSVTADLNIVQNEEDNIQMDDEDMLRDDNSLSDAIQSSGSSNTGVVMKQCPTCFGMFSSTNEAEEHEKICIEMFKCSWCGMVFESRMLLKIHNESEHTVLFPIKIKSAQAVQYNEKIETPKEQKNNKFQNSKILIRKHNLLVKTETFKSKRRKKQLQTVSQVVRIPTPLSFIYEKLEAIKHDHQYCTSNNKTLLTCPACGAAFSSITNFTLHKESHFQCVLCGMYVEDELCLLKHTRKYHQSKHIYKCHICNRYIRFKTLALFKEHIEMHVKSRSIALNIHNKQKIYDRDITMVPLESDDITEVPLSVLKQTPVVTKATPVVKKQVPIVREKRVPNNVMNKQGTGGIERTCHKRLTCDICSFKCSTLRTLSAHRSYHHQDVKQEQSHGEEYPVLLVDKASTSVSEQFNSSDSSITTYPKNVKLLKELRIVLTDCMKNGLITRSAKIQKKRETRSKRKQRLMEENKIWQRWYVLREHSYCAKRTYS